MSTPMLQTPRSFADRCRTFVQLHSPQARNSVSFQNSEPSRSPGALAKHFRRRLLEPSITPCKQNVAGSSPTPTRRRTTCRGEHPEGYVPQCAWDVPDGYPETLELDAGRMRARRDRRCKHHLPSPERNQRLNQAPLMGQPGDNPAPPDGKVTLPVRPAASRTTRKRATPSSARQALQPAHRWRQNLPRTLIVHSLSYHFVLPACVARLTACHQSED